MSTKTRHKQISVDYFGPEIERALEQGGEPALWAMGDELLDAARRRAPRDSGRLRASGYVETERRSSYRRQHGDRKRRPDVKRGAAVVAFASWYSNLFEDTGAKAHAIGGSGRSRRRLHIPGVGYRMSARHPGHKRQPFLGPALEATRTGMVDEYCDELRKRLERAT